MATASSKVCPRTVIAFLVSAVLVAIIIGIVFIYSPNTAPWQSNPGNIALVISGIVVCFLVSLLVQTRFDLKNLRDYFENMAVTDSLTNVFNRRYVDENINRLVKSVNRAGGAMTLMMVDLDSFRTYNDAYGHSKGDECLKTIASLISGSLKRDNDFVARYGGEEFLIILPSTDEKGAGLIADRLLSIINECRIPHTQSGIADYVTVSIGAVTGGGNYTQSGDDFINRAYEALHASKQNGHNQYTLLNMYS